MHTFEHTYQLSESEYVNLYSLLSRRRPAVYARRVAFVAIGVTCLFFPYTVLLGVVDLVIAAVLFFTPYTFPGTTANNFRQFGYLRGPATYGVDQDSVWIRKPDFIAKVSWHHVTVWRERHGWLMLQGNGFPPIILPIAGLQSAGVYDWVKETVQRHAKEFGAK
jgi:hypothetical protein